MTWHVTALDATLAPVEELGRVRSISIERSAKEKAPLLESASVEFDAEPPFPGGWHLIEHKNGSERRAYGVFWLEPKSIRVDAAVTTVTADGRSVLKDAAEATLSPGSYARIGTDAALFAAEMLSSCPGSVTVHGSATLPRSIVFDDGASALEAAWRVLDEVGWRIRIDGRGGVHIEELPSVAAIRITRADSHGVLPGISYEDAPGYTRVDEDDVRPLDMVAVNMPRNGVDGEWRVMTQSISAGVTAQVGEKLGERSIEW